MTNTISKATNKATKGKEKNLPAGRQVIKSGKKSGHLADLAAEALAQEAVIEEKAKKLEKEIETKAKKTSVKETKPEIKAKTKAKPAKKHGADYLAASKKVDQNKSYLIADAVKLLKSVSISKFSGSVDVHLVVHKAGLKGEIEFPHPTGKKQNIRIADDQLLKDLDKGKIDFTLLISTPQMMSKLMKYGKILGPKGLMPNPGAGTITDKPEAVAKKLTAKTRFKTEAKAPLIHIKIGKVDQKESELSENFKALIEAVGRKNIQKAVIAPTMGPGIKIDLASLA
jgi:large subunit ribosomal protein L1